MAAGEADASYELRRRVLLERSGLGQRSDASITVGDESDDASDIHGSRVELISFEANCNYRFFCVTGGYR